MQSLSLFLRVHEMFQFPAFPCAAYVFSCAYRGIARGGFPHSDIPGSRPVCGSPRLFAAYHVLRRLPAPRHPPCALRSLTNYFSNRLFARLLSLVSLQLSFLARYPLVVFPFALFLFTSPFHSLSSLFPMRLPKSIPGTAPWKPGIEGRARRSDCGSFDCRHVRLAGASGLFATVSIDLESGALIQPPLPP